MEVADYSETLVTINTTSRLTIQQRLDDATTKASLDVPSCIHRHEFPALTVKLNESLNK